MRFEEYTGNEVDNPNAKLAILNPFRYRSYYYDSETNLYYLNSRYYDPELGRFINADDISVLDISRSELNGLNLYCYCLNNPVNDFDASGYLLMTLLIGALIGAVISFAASVITQGTTKGFKNINWGVVALDTLIGGLLGAVSASPIGIIGQMAIGGFLSVTQYVGGQLIQGEQITTGGVLLSFGLGVLFGASDGLLTGKMPGTNIDKTIFVKEIESQTVEKITRQGLKSGLQHYYKHFVSKLVVNYVFNNIKIAGINFGVDLIKHFYGQLIKGKFSNKEW